MAIFGGTLGRPVCRAGCQLVRGQCVCSFANRYSSVLRGAGLGRAVCRAGCQLVKGQCVCNFGNRYSSVLRGYGFGEGEDVSAGGANAMEQPITAPPVVFVEPPMITPSGGISDFFASLPPWAPWAAIAVVALMRR